MKVAGRVQENLRYLKRTGHILGVIPQGYCRVDGAIVEDPEVAPVIRQIFELYATGTFSFQTLGRPSQTASASARGVVPARRSTIGQRRSSSPATSSKSIFDNASYIQARFRVVVSSSRPNTRLSSTRRRGTRCWGGAPTQPPEHEQDVDAAQLPADPSAAMRTLRGAQCTARSLSDGGGHSPPTTPAMQLDDRRAATTASRLARCDARSDTGVSASRKKRSVQELGRCTVYQVTTCTRRLWRREGRGGDRSRLTFRTHVTSAGPPTGAVWMSSSLAYRQLYEYGEYDWDAFPGEASTRSDDARQSLRNEAVGHAAKNGRHRLVPRTAPRPTSPHGTRRMTVSAHDLLSAPLQVHRRRSSFCSESLRLVAAPRGALEWLLPVVGTGAGEWGSNPQLQTLGR